MKIAEEHGLFARTNEQRVLTTKDVALGFGRRATEAELIEYLLKNQSDEVIDIDTVLQSLTTKN